jgi:hypothetical protein
LKALVVGENGVRGLVVLGVVVDVGQQADHRFRCVLLQCRVWKRMLHGSLIGGRNLELEM